MLEKAEKERKKTLSPCFVPSRRARENSKKIEKKLKKLKNTIMDLFQAKIGWRRMRKRENKNYRSVPTRCVIENSKKGAKKYKKIKKYHCGFISCQNRLEKAAKDRK